MGKTWNDFKTFALKGNVVDMAVGVIIGGGFSKVVSSLVSDLIMPFISLLVGKISFTNWKWVIQSSQKGLEPIVINYGLFIQTCLDFFIVAFSIFFMVKIATHMANKWHKQAAPTTPSLTKEEILLTEIRDILKKEKND